MSKAKTQNHGTTSSYVIGFILSLIFTIIPYHLVVNKVLTGNELLVAILGIAIVQMFIQIFFFLHLGRGPKPFYNIVFFVATAGLIVIVVGASLFIMDNLYRTMSPEEAIRKLAQKENISKVGDKETGACKENKANHTIVIKGDTLNPMHVAAKLCDTISFVNEDGTPHEIAFGVHPEDISYGGVDTIALDDERPEIVTLNQSGEFMIHDHANPALFGHFTVEP